MANNVDPIQTVCSESTLFASIPNSSAILGNSLQQMTSADAFSGAFYLGALRVKRSSTTVYTSAWAFKEVFCAYVVTIKMACADPTLFIYWLSASLQYFLGYC